MKKFLVLTSLFLALAFPDSSFASSATSVVETQVEGEAQVYQYIETTVDGQTVKKESTQPGKLELKMEKTGDAEPTVSFSQEPATSPSTAESVTLEVEKRLKKRTSPHRFLSGLPISSNNFSAKFLGFFKTA